MTQNNRINRRLIPPGIPTLIILLAILYLTLAPQPVDTGDIQLFQGADKIVHAVMFGALTLAILYDIKSILRQIPRPSIISLATVISIATGGLVELLQSWMTLGRSAEWLDFAADAAGALIAACCFRLWFTRAR